MEAIFNKESVIDLLESFPGISIVILGLSSSIHFDILSGTIGFLLEFLQGVRLEYFPELFQWFNGLFRDPS